MPKVESINVNYVGHEDGEQLKDNLIRHDKQWPWFFHYRYHNFCMWKMQSEHRREACLPNFDTARTTQKNQLVLNESVIGMELLLFQNQQMAALSNDLAVGRKTPEHDGKNNQPVIPFFGLRGLDAFFKVEGKRKLIGKDKSFQARAYSFEAKWLETIVPKWQEGLVAWRDKNDLGEFGIKDQPTTVEVASRTDASEEMGLFQLYMLLSEDQGKNVAALYSIKFKDFSNLWHQLLIQPVTEGGPVETLLAFTDSHVSIINKAHQKGKKLLELSQHLEGVLYRVAEDRLISHGTAVVLELNSFDDDCAAWYRDDLLESLGPHKDSMLPLMPRLLQRWQSDKLEKAVKSLADIERAMKSWIKDHGQDPANQGVHLNEEKLFRDIEAAEDTKLCWNALRDTTPGMVNCPKKYRGVDFRLPQKQAA